MNMRTPAYKTCVSVGQSTPAAMRQTLLRALRCSEYAEARLDYLTHKGVFELLDSLPPDALRERIICTLRARYDGGKFRGSEDTRIAMLRQIASAYAPWLLDVELAALKYDKRLGSDIGRSGGRVLASWHDFEGMPTVAQMRKKLDEMARHTPHLKIACRAQTVSESARMLEMYGWLERYNAGSRGKRSTLISFAMGKAGSLTRILCMHMGSPYTYVSLGRALAPGQLSLEEIKKMEKTMHAHSPRS